MKRVLYLLVFAGMLQAQTTPAPTPAPSATPDASIVNIPAKLPASLGFTFHYNQLGTPRWTGSVVAAYPIVQSQGIYGTLTTDIVPMIKTDPTTGKNFFSLVTSVRPGAHKKLYSIGKWDFFVGGDFGPAVSASATNVATGGAGALSISLSTSVTGTAVFHASSRINLIAPIRMLYVAGTSTVPGGWNPVLAVGMLVNLSKSPAPAKTK